MHFLFPIPLYDLRGEPAWSRQTARRGCPLIFAIYSALSGRCYCARRASSRPHGFVRCMAKLFGSRRAPRGSDAPRVLARLSAADGEAPAADACEEHNKQRAAAARPLSQPGGGTGDKKASVEGHRAVTGSTRHGRGRRDLGQGTRTTPLARA